MANQTLLSIIDTNIVIPGSWEYQCISNLNSSAFSWHRGLVNGQGHLMTAFTNATWGISFQDCQTYCNHRQIPFIFNFQSFASSMTNYFLPWLALTAQLPFETGDFLTNALSFCMAVGSPALVTYSLSLTILNRYWVRKEFDELKTKAHGSGVRSKYEALEDRVKACRFLLQEAQQVPLRASMEKGWFSSLIVSPANSSWWDHLERRLRSTRRGVTASLVAQMLFAGIAYLFTVIASFQADLGDPATALQIASGSLWIWLIPVIAGLISAGTQYSHHSIEDALLDFPASRALELPIQPGQQLSEPCEQKGLVVRPGLNPLPHDHQTVNGGFEVADIERLKIPTWFGAEVGGDERKKGPIFNYARIFTWWQLASSIDSALFNTLENVSDNRTCEQPQRTVSGRWVPSDHAMGDSGATAQYCGLDIKKRILAYPGWGEIPSRIYNRMIAAALVAIFLQWGTTGASILIAYLTPTVGLGCRSGSYTLYGALATASWLCLLLSMALSHEVMLRYQAVHRRTPTIDFRRRPTGSAANTYTRTWFHATLCGCAVILRRFGKLLAVLNTIWLIASSLMEFVGAYDNCWCKGNYVGMGNNGWIVLFKGAADLAAQASLPWGGGLAMTVLVCLISYTFFLFGSLQTDDD